MYPLVESVPGWVAKEERQYEAGQLILEPFGQNQHLYILANGSATVYNYGLNGEVLNIYDYEAVDYFGEVELLCGQRYPLMVQAKTPCTALRIPQKDFLRWLREDADFALYIMRRLSEKLLVSADKLVRFSMMDIRQRYLLAVYGYHKSGKLNTVTKAQIAEMVCAPVRSLNRIIAQNGNLVRYKKQFWVEDENGLEEACADIQQLLWQKNG